MSSKLKRLISHCETEHRTLTAAVEECVAEGDYGTAHRLAKGLQRLAQKLQILKNIQDPLHDQKERAIHYIKGIEKLSESESGRALDYYRERIAAERQKLAALEAPAAEQANAPPATALHSALMKLFNVRIIAFTLVLNEPQRLYLTLRLLRRTLLITLPEVQRHQMAHTLAKRHVRKLRALGFRLYDHRDKLLLFLPFGGIEDIYQVKIIMARIAFDCFYSKGLKGNSSIHYYEPTS